jgi:hypothetical protein
MHSNVMYMYSIYVKKTEPDSIIGSFCSSTVGRVPFLLT